MTSVQGTTFEDPGVANPDSGYERMVMSDIDAWSTGDDLGQPEVSFKEHPQGVVIYLRVKPGSSRCRVEGLESGHIVAYVHAPPAEGQANQEVIGVLSKVLGLPASRLEIIRGRKSRQKTILVRGLSPADARARLESIQA